MLIRMATRAIPRVGAVTDAAVDRGFFGHPRGLSTLFFTEMWERFSYYGMRAFLMLYMVAPASAGGLGFADADAASIYGTYTGSVWGAAILGGIVADRFLGQYNSVLIGGDKSARLRIKALIAHLDTPLESGGDTQVIYLQFADAEKIAAKLKEQISATVAITTGRSRFCSDSTASSPIPGQPNTTSTVTTPDR